jgi:hypothetical protein
MERCHCSICCKRVTPDVDGEEVNGVILCSGCQRDAEEVEEDAAASPYDEVRN